MLIYIKRIVRIIIGETNLIYLRSLIRSKKEKELLDKRSKFYSNFIKKDDLFFDVGANLGNRIEAILVNGARVVAIEPQEVCYKYLMMKFKDSIEIVKKGVGSSEGLMDFYVSNVHLTSSFSKSWIDSVKKSQRFKKRNWDKVVKVEITTLDKLIDNYGQPQFIKIDVEGFEMEVMNGLSKPVSVVSFEYTVPELSINVVKCINRLLLLSPNYVFNYSIGESMELSLSKWISASEMIDFISSPEFENTRFGDIYAKKN